MKKTTVRHNDLQESHNIILTEEATPKQHSIIQIILSSATGHPICSL